LTAFHNLRLQTAAKLVEEEQWNQADIPRRLASDVEMLILSATNNRSEDPSATIAISPFEEWEDPRRTTQSIETVRSLQIEDQNFILVPATIRSLDMLCSYVKLLINLESVVTDVMAKIIEFLKVSRFLSMFRTHLH
jgi:vacuolar protein sorting-associated protein 54